MAKEIDYFYAPISGYAYLGERKLIEIAHRYAAKINFKPIDIATVFAKSETTPPFKQSDTRLKYRLNDLERVAKKLSLQINPKPKHWPVPVELAATTIYSAVDLGIDPHLVSFALLSAVYAEEKDISDQAQVKQILSTLNLDAEKILQNRASCHIQYNYETATDEAVSLGVFGSPTYIYEGELYFGQDRLSFLEHHLAEKPS